jgi:hypothetical protein
MVKRSTLVKLGKYGFIYEAIIATFCILVLICYGLYLLIMYIRNKTEKYDDYFTCTMTLNDINPNLVNEYMKYDNKHVPYGICKNATLKMVVNTCPDVDGVQSPNCKPTADVVSSNGVPINYISNVSFDGITSFFGVS